MKLRAYVYPKEILEGLMLTKPTESNECSPHFPIFLHYLEQKQKPSLGFQRWGLLAILGINSDGISPALSHFSTQFPFFSLFHSFLLSSFPISQHSSLFSLSFSIFPQAISKKFEVSLCSKVGAFPRFRT